MRWSLIAYVREPLHYYSSSTSSFSLYIYGKGRRSRSDSLFLLVENIFSPALLFSKKMSSFPLMVESNFSSTFLLEDESVSCRVWSRVATTPRPPPPSLLSSFRGGKRSRSDHLLFDDREYLLIHCDLLSSFFSLLLWRGEKE